MMAQGNLDKVRCPLYFMVKYILPHSVAKREDMHHGWPSGHLMPPSLTTWWGLELVVTSAV